MRACRLDREEKSDFALAAHAADARMVSRMRLVLAVSVLLAVSLDPVGLSSVSPAAWLVLFGYLAHSAVVCLFAHRNRLSLQSRWVHRLDVLWFAAIVGLTGSVDSFFFLFFLFAILVSSFGWGLEEGARVTLASAALFAASGWWLDTGHDLPRLLLRTTFLLALGYLCVHWGESTVQLMRQLALLRDVSRLSNPRFGVDHTLTGILKKTCAFFSADSCLLILQDRESGAYTVRTVRQGEAALCLNAEPMAPEAAAPLLAVAPGQVALYSRPPWPAMAFLLEEFLVCDSEDQHWTRQKKASAASLADMLEARAFISAPVPLRRQHGRLYVLARHRAFDKADALFLGQMAAQAFPVLENIELLDKMASEAALRERKKMSLNLHDTAIQPYVGLKLGLSALRHQAAADNPLVAELERLIAMTEKVIRDLRQYARSFQGAGRAQAPDFLTLLRQQAAQMQEFYGVNIDIAMSEEIAVSDRLGTEVVQMVREGLANIRKHTLAQRGFVKIDCVNGRLSIQIENESPGANIEAGFVPRSLSERAADLGGTVRVLHAPRGNTVVHVEIPV